MGRALLPAVGSGDVPAGAGAGAGQCPCVGTTQRAPGLHRLLCEDHGCWLNAGHVAGGGTSVKTSSFQGLLHLLLESLWLGPGLVPAHGPPYPQRAEPSVPLCPLAGTAASLCAPSHQQVWSHPLTRSLAGRTWRGPRHLGTGGGSCLNRTGVCGGGRDPLAPAPALDQPDPCHRVWWAHKGWRHVQAGLPEATAGPPSLICAVTT